MIKTVLLISVVFILSIAVLGDSGNDGKNKKIRKSILAGSWYEGNPNVLSTQIEMYLKNVPDEKVKDNIIGIIAPHAGYAYSAQTAAYVYKALENRDIDRVIILAPSHSSYFNGIAATEATAFETPLGLVEVDTAIVHALLKNPVFLINENAHSREHSLEIQLPLLQKVTQNVKIVPLIVGNMDKDDYKDAAKVLARYLTDKTVVIASSDFTHFGKRFDYMPFKDNIPENLKNLDLNAVELIKNHDNEGFMSYISKTGATICGFRPIALLMALMPKDSNAELLNYTTSGDMTGEYDNSVSYASVVFSGKFPKLTAQAETEEKEDGEDADLLNDDEKKFILKLAHDVLHTVVTNNGKFVMDDSLKQQLTPRLKRRAGAFVTLSKKGDLRGCIGYIQPIEPLYLTVINNAVNASLNDTRFMPVSEKELPDIDIEISVLTPPKRVNGYKDIIIGKHGMILEKNRRSAVFLPQVAVEQNWDLATTLTHLSYKAGLPPDAWKENAEFLVFEAQVFGKGHN